MFQSGKRQEKLISTVVDVIYFNTLSLKWTWLCRQEKLSICFFVVTVGFNLFLGWLSCIHFQQSVIMDENIIINICIQVM